MRMQTAKSEVEFCMLLVNGIGGCCLQLCCAIAAAAHLEATTEPTNGQCSATTPAILLTPNFIVQSVHWLL
jgi:hypothetical protein